MRFYFGLSKRIKVKTLIEILGFLFVGLMAFFGFTQIGYCWTDISNGADLFSHKELNVYALDRNLQPEVYESAYLQKYTGNSYRTFLNLCVGTSSYCANSSSTNRPSGQRLAVTQGAYNQDYPFIFDDWELNFTPVTPYCSTSSYNSMNFRFMLSYPGEYEFNHYYSYFGLENNYSTNLDGFKYKGLFVRVYAHETTNNGENLYPTNCSIGESGLTGGGSYSTLNLVTCNNLFIGNSEHSVDYYIISINNGVPFSNVYNSSTDNAYLSTLLTIEVPKNANYVNRAYLQYECSTDDPVIDNPTDTLDIEKELTDVYDYIKGSYDTDLPGIDVEKFKLNYPQNMQDLISLPLYVIDKVVENSSTCSPYEIDLSGIANLAPPHNYSNIKITLPCMRTKLSSLLGALYTLIDVLMASLVFYNIAMAIIILVEAITSGVDLWTFYFSNTNEGRKMRHDIFIGE